ncbi:PEPxxWA-CTERM sorting domain-containing protein [Parasphingorhabdus cellanae]|uniref:PEP-CTERM sorting domain-containing protein n=1 Tax=Parasphingorhabdus cellanae TaxID=2806553 RepID=A0ABX7T6Z1_9SPHN|nr:PEPxxWA-CTERM sorting domain-containing protein [Parasphingorhabdus cellanae]QTD56234.1 PEP-CTERM sorting domain-containing protein [Parasphingorhabdus cellanae]
MSLKNFAKAAGLGALLCSTSANAAIVLSYAPVDAVYSGATPVIDFDSPTPEFSGAIVTGTTPGDFTEPLGASGNYGAVGPLLGTPETLDLSGIPGDLAAISFIWGSVDFSNVLDVLDASDNVIYSLTGKQLLDFGAPGGLPYTNPELNPVVTLSFTDGDLGLAKKLQFSATKNSFEFDNFAVNAVPEPATWAFMIFGFGAIGTALRRRRSDKPALKLA